MLQSVMILIRFGIPGKYWLPWLCPATCAYYFSPFEYQNALSCTMGELDEFEQQCKQHHFSFVIARNLRVGSFDATGRVSNRFAHTYIILTYEPKRCSRKEQWRMFHYNLKAISFLHGRNDISTDVVRRIESMVWKNCGDLHRTFVRATKRMIRHIVPKLSGKMLAPDYVWRTGTNAGRTTMSILSERWNHRIQSMD